MGKSFFSWLAVVCVAITTLAASQGAISASPESTSANYNFLVASGFLCDAADSSTCPAVVRSTQGDSYEMSGAGTLNTQGKSVTAAGAFTHKSPNDQVLEAGVWIASELVRFDSYGIAPGALMREGWTLGPPQFGAMRSRMFSGSMPAGGRAVFRIRLLPMWGPSKTATLEVNCAQGKVPDEHPTEGIRLAFKGGRGEFDQEISGRTLFVLTRLAASPTNNSPAPPDETNPAPDEGRGSRAPDTKRDSLR